jgi:putative transposase
MARLPRLQVPGYPLHLVIRGNDRKDIFRSEGDKIYFHRCLVETSRNCGARIHAYVFMSNHVHLLASGDHHDSISKTVQSMGRRYVSYFNYLYKRTGTLWEGRYHSSLVQTDRYLLACYRYIEMNPVRAGVEIHPGNYRWSSYGFNARGGTDDLVTPHSLYESLGHTAGARRQAYVQLFDAVIPDLELGKIRSALAKGWALGDEAFCSEVGPRAGRRAAPLPRGRPKNPQNSEN